MNTESKRRKTTIILDNRHVVPVYYSFITGGNNDSFVACRV